MTLSIILVNTQMPENIGSAARAMLNFGLSDLRLVAPREEWPNKRAYDLAGHGAPILDKARLFASTREAVGDFTRVYAATARSRELVKPVLEPAEAMQRIRDEGERVAILFGPERSGLTNDDIAVADAIITIPTGSELASLNIAQSVVVLAYEWFIAPSRRRSEPQALKGKYPGLCRDDDRRTTGPAASPVNAKSPLATKDELQHLYDHLERELDGVNFWKVDDKKIKMWLNLRSIFARNNLTSQEVWSLHGVIACLREDRGEGRGRSGEEVLDP